MNFIEHIFNEPSIQAVGWTIVHSIWQISLIVLIAAVTLVFVHKKKASTRYTIITAFLLCIILSSVTTFRYSYKQALSKRVQQTTYAKNNVTQTLIKESENETDTKTTISETSSKTHIISLFEKYFERHLPAIVSLWFIGVVILLLKYLGALAWMFRLRSLSEPAEEKYQDLLVKLCRKMKLKRFVDLAISLKIKSPVLTGHIKPIIMFPAGLLSKMSLKELEAVLMHEIAHVKRNDYITNLIFGFVELLFFYHPAVWWISSSLKTEREHACDDLAIQAGVDKLIFAKTITGLSISHEKERVPGLAFSGKQHKLKHRINRLINSNMKTNSITKSLFAILLPIVIVTLAFSIPKAENNEYSSIIPQNNSFKMSDYNDKSKNDVLYYGDDDSEAFLISIMKKGSKEWNKFRSTQPNNNFGTTLKESNLSGMNLSNFNMSEIDLKEADLQNVNFTNADMQGVNIKEATVKGAIFNGTDLRKAVMSELDLTGCSMVKADLRRANMKEVVLVEADLSQADIRGTDLHQAVIENTKFKQAISDYTTRLPEGFEY